MLQRRSAREAALKAVYAVEVGKNSTADVIQRMLKPDLKDHAELYSFSEKLFLLTVDHASTHDELIQKHIKNWDVNRLAIIDRLILRLAITEFLYFEHIPTKVTMNEAIELAKDYSTRKSGNFVNGILDAVLSTLNDEHRINKKGRGLIGSS